MQRRGKLFRVEIRQGLCELEKLVQRGLQWL